LFSYLRGVELRRKAQGSPALVDVRPRKIDGFGGKGRLAPFGTTMVA
jgi:hypothetical protein